MPKVNVDVSTCVGCGLCEQSCPDVFAIGGDGIAHIKVQSCSMHNLEEIAEQCPVDAIKVSQ